MPDAAPAPNPTPFATAMPLPAATDPAREYLPGGDQLRYSGLSFTARLLPQTNDDISRAFGPEIYEYMTLDAAIAGSLSKIATGVLSGPIHVVPRLPAVPGRDPTPEQARSAEVADQNRAMLDNLDRPLPDVLKEMIEALAFGNKLAEVVEHAELTGGVRCIRAIRPKSWWTWQFGIDPAGNVLGIVPSRGYVGLGAPVPMPSAPGGGDAGMLGVGPLLDPAHFAVLTWDMRGGDPRGRSLLRPCYPWWNEKRQSIPDYRKFMRRFASPKPVATIPNNAGVVPQLDLLGNPTGAYEDCSLAVLKRLQTWDNDSALTLPEGVTLELVEPKGDGKAFGGFFTFCDQMIHGAILQSARAVMEAEHGSKADATVAQEGAGSLYRFVGGWLGRWVRAILYRQNVINYGAEDARAYTPDVVVGEAEHQDVAAMLPAYASVGYKAAPSQYAAIDAILSLPERTETPEEMAALDAPPAAPGKASDPAEEGGETPPPGTADAKPKGKS